jgi:hypothetical protein
MNCNDAVRPVSLQCIGIDRKHEHHCPKWYPGGGGADGRGRKPIDDREWATRVFQSPTNIDFTSIHDVDTQLLADVR